MLKSLVRKYLFDRRGKTVTSRTELSAIRSLLCRLHPVSCGVPLIRFGPPGDGGYLIPDDLEGIVACFSPGVSTISGFERDCADRGMEVFLADKSVDGPAEFHKAFHFSKRFIGAFTDSDYITLDDWVSESLPGSQGPLLLQIDIEGFEYEVFLSASSSLMRRFRIIVGEFHNIDQLWNRPFFNLAARTFEKLLHTHTCVHVHPNNYGYSGRPQHEEIALPSGMEFTFVRKDRAQSQSFRTDFPHELDSDNTDFPHMPLPVCWYRQPDDRRFAG